MFAPALPPLPAFVCALTAWLIALPGSPGSEVVHPPAEYTLREWHEQDGLLSEELAGVVQDGRGYLWVASNNGLTRFDGRVFQPIALPPGAYTRGLARIPAHGDLAEDVPALGANARAEAGSSGAGGYFQMRDGAAVFHPEERLAGRSTREILGAPDGTLWLGCDDGTLLRRKGGEFEVFDPLPEPASRKTLAFATDAEGAVWLLRGNRLFHASAPQPREITFPRVEPELRIASSARGGVWVFTREALLRWDGTTMQEVLKLPELLGAHFVQATLEDSHGYLWVGTRSQGLFRIIGTEVTPVPSSGENITGLCEDADGNIWAATNGGGLSRLRPRAHRLYDQTTGLKDPFSYTVAEDAGGGMWLANRDGGMARITNGAVDPISRRAGWRAFSAMSVYPDPGGAVWMTSGIAVFRTRAGEPEALERIAPLNALRGVRATFVSRSGDYWLSVDPDRVARYRDGALSILGPESGFDGRDVRAFAEDAAGRVWIGAADGRLYHTDGDRLARVELPQSDALGSLQVIRFEADGTMLIGTTRYGVLIAPQGDLARAVPLFHERGLPTNNITQILIDDHDRHWFASRGGIFWVHSHDVRAFAAGRTDRVHAVPLGKDDGLPYLTCLGLFQPAAWKARDGTLWFATRRGVLRTDPTLLTSGATVPPPVAITRITCDGADRRPAPTLDIQSSVRRIQIHLSALNLSAPESVQVRYRLEGFDNDWVQDDERVATYPRLPPGRYVFSTRASIGSGSWSHQPAQLTIVVTPPWWKSYWAQAGYLLILIAIITVIARNWAHRRLRLRLERAEYGRAVEQERARIARNIHDDVGASLTRISLLTQAALDEAAPQSSTLEKIYEATRAITRSMDEIVWAVNPRHDNTESLVYYIGNYAQTFLGTAGIRCRLESPPQLPEATLTTQVRHHIFLGCKEALNNIVKHASASEVTIRIDLDRPGRLAISITDNGRGLAPARADALAGDGLENMRQRMTEIRADCTVATGSAGGTVVTFSVPLDPPPAP